VSAIADFLLARIAKAEAYWGDPLLAAPGALERRMLAECESKRGIVELHSGGHECPGVGHVFWDDDASWTKACPTLRLVALPYADHPDYDEAWRL